MLYINGFEDREKSRETKKTVIYKTKTKNSVFVGLFIICLLFFVVMVVVNIFILRYAMKNPMLAEDIYTSTFLTDGLTLIGLAISVWAGLNIANAIERKELEQNMCAIDKLKKDTNEIQKEFKPISENIENISNTLWFLFENEILKTRDDEATLFLYNVFTKKSLEKSQLLIRVLPDLIVIEQLFNQVYVLHDSKQELNQEIQDRGIKGIDRIKRCLQVVEDSGDVDIIYYLKFRMAEFHFYLGYTTKDLGYVYYYYKTAGDLYLELHEYFTAFLPEYSEMFFDCNGKMDVEKCVPKFSKDSQSDIKLSIYFANSICEAYSRIVLCVNENDFKAGDKQYTKDGYAIEDLKEITQKAIFYGFCSTKWAENTLRNEVYFRNLGCAYERYERLFGKLGMYHNEIISNYKKAFELIIDNKVIPYRIQSVYHTLISYLRKYLEAKLNISNVFIDNEDSGNLDALKIALANNDILTKEDADYIKIYYETTCFAKVDNPRARLQYSTNGLALSIIAYFKLKGDSMAAQICHLSIEECLGEMEKDISILKLMKDNKNDVFFKWLIKRKDVLKAYYVESIEKR